KFGLIYVDTGAIYRCVGLSALRAGIASKDRDGVSEMLPSVDITIKYDESGTQRMILNGEDVSDAIRTPEASIYASDVSAMPEVRAFLLEMQRSLARKSDVIMDGRDIGTVVLPNAGLKIFLTARAEVRAERRLIELKEKNIETTFEEVLRDIEYRDKNDSSRKEAPLRQADDAILIDTSEIDLEASFELICGVVGERLGR
ncbi:MAG: (d)CMP kinase, partial [Oscillospiraceae bacterium]|nr:(d)CMP kinase [Oscillospiraceae bacterium]